MLSGKNNSNVVLSPKDSANRFYSHVHASSPEETQWGLKGTPPRGKKTKAMILRLWGKKLGEGLKEW